MNTDDVEVLMHVDGTVLAPSGRWKLEGPREDRTMFVEIAILNKTTRKNSLLKRCRGSAKYEEYRHTSFQWVSERNLTFEVPPKINGVRCPWQWDW